MYPRSDVVVVSSISKKEEKGRELDKDMSNKHIDTVYTQTSFFLDKNFCLFIRALGRFLFLVIVVVWYNPYT